MNKVHRAQRSYLRRLVPSVLILLAAMMSPVYAQFNDTMDTVLAQDTLTLGSASFILLSGAGQLPDTASPEEAAAMLSEKVSGVTVAWDQEITLGQFSWYLMQVYHMEGGLMYRLAPGGRYALRELRFLNIVQGQAFAKSTLTGERAVRILGRYLSWKEAGK